MCVRSRVDSSEATHLVLVLTARQTPVLRKKHPLSDLRRFSRFNLFQPVFMVQTSKDGAGNNSLTTRDSVT